MNSTIDYANLPPDPLVDKLKEKCTRPAKTFGEVAVGPKKAIFPAAYLDQARKILDMEVRPDDTWIISLPRSGKKIFRFFRH